MASLDMSHDKSAAGTLDLAIGVTIPFFGSIDRVGNIIVGQYYHLKLDRTFF
jgi:hypothetical protein